MPPSTLQSEVPRCLRCAYVLSGLPSPGKCPECAAPFDLRDPRTFVLRPPFLRWKFWAPGLGLAVGAGFVLVPVLAFAFGVWGASLWLGVPFAAGAILGYRIRAKWYILPMFGLVVLLMLVLGVASMGLAGVFCGLVLGLVFLVPILIGAGCGALLRAHLKRTTFSQRGYLPILAFMLIPVVWALVEGPAAPAAIETVTTEQVLPASAPACWDAIMFYEEVTHPPPWILRVGLARPLYTSGSSRKPGDQKVCVYNKGRIVKRITRADPPSLLSFDIVEQHIGYERDVRLIRGSFEFLPIDAVHTRVRLTTVYEPYLGPRFCWWPAEHLAVHILHGYVLEGMRLATDPQPAKAGP